MKVRNFALSTDVIAYVRDELHAYRRNEPLTCAILRHEGRPYVVLSTASGVVAADERQLFQDPDTRRADCLRRSTAA